MHAIYTDMNSLRQATIKHFARVAQNWCTLENNTNSLLFVLLKLQQALFLICLQFPEKKCLHIFYILLLCLQLI